MKSNFKFIISILAAALLMQIFTTASASDGPSDQELYNRLPEVSSADKGSNTRTGGAYMDCIVDTINYDITGNPCWSFGTETFASAFFTIHNLPSNYTIIWSDSRCSQSSFVCVIPIRMFRTLQVSAIVLNNDAGTFTNVSATATYEGLF